MLFLFEINLLLWRVSDCKVPICINYLYMCVPYIFPTCKNFSLLSLQMKVVFKNTRKPSQSLDALL